MKSWTLIKGRETMRGTYTDETPALAWESAARAYGHVSLAAWLIEIPLRAGETLRAVRS